ncbi:hypothetical protein [Paenibacillus sp. KN14-4R]|uniref:hypothetical protein n=1 Tax=Paenibacillus sp. KN14-4R TaxID=3445773 RepID=UPI003F9FB5E2
MTEMITALPDQLFVVNVVGTCISVQSDYGKQISKRVAEQLDGQVCDAMKKA